MKFFKGSCYMEFIYGVHPIVEAIKAKKRKIEKIIFADNPTKKALMQIKNLAISNKIEIQILDKNQFSKLCDLKKSQKVLAEVSPFPVIVNDLSILKDLNFVLILDGILDPQNLGAIIRTSLCADIQAIILPKNNSAPISAAASKASAGAIEHCTILTVTNLARSIDYIKQNTSMWVVGLDVQAENNIYNLDLKRDLSVVVGSEESGIRRLVKEKCDHLASIPQSKKLNSLNASTSTAIFLYEILRQKFF